MSLTFPLHVYLKALHVYLPCLSSSFCLASRPCPNRLPCWPPQPLLYDDKRTLPTPPATPTFLSFSQSAYLSKLSSLCMSLCSFPLGVTCEHSSRLANEYRPLALPLSNHDVRLPFRLAACAMALLPVQKPGRKCQKWLTRHHGRCQSLLPCRNTQNRFSLSHAPFRPSPHAR